MCYMTTVGIRQLRQNASALLRLVAAGETIEITDHGHAVARIVPLHSERALDQLIAEGRASEAKGDLLEMDAAPTLAGEPRLSDVLAEMRADER